MVANKLIGLPPPKHVTTGEYPRLFGKQTSQLGGVEVGVDQ